MFKIGKVKPLPGGKGLSKLDEGQIQKRLYGNFFEDDGERTTSEASIVRTTVSAGTNSNVVPSQKYSFSQTQNNKKGKKSNSTRITKEKHNPKLQTPISDLTDNTSAKDQVFFGDASIQGNNYKSDGFYDKQSGAEDNEGVIAHNDDSTVLKDVFLKIFGILIGLLLGFLVVKGGIYLVSLKSNKLPKQSSQTVKTSVVDSRTSHVEKNNKLSVSPKMSFPYYTVQIALLDRVSQAKNMVSEFTEKGYKSRYFQTTNTRGVSKFRIYIGYFKTKNEAAEFLNKFTAKEGFKDSFIRKIEK